MEEINLSHTLDKLDSSAAGERNKGLADLKQILSHHRQSEAIRKLFDKAYHQMLEALFRLTKNECSIYAKASGTAQRLSDCAGLVRMIVVIGVRRLRFKTVKALVEHIVQTLSISNKSYCEPLLVDYFRSLETILEYQPHCEHFTEEEWLEILEFCNETLHDKVAGSSGGNYADTVYGSSIVIPSRSRHGRSPAPSIAMGRGRKANDRGSQRATETSVISLAQDRVLCIKHLVSATNAHVLGQAQVTLTNLCDLLATLSSVGLELQTVFESINSILTRIMTDDISLMMQTIRTLLPNIRRLWDMNSSTLRDHMLTSLLYGEIYFSCLVVNDETGDCINDLSRLLQVFRQEYSKRPEREQLQLEDLDLPDDPFRSERPSSMKAFELRSGALRAEQPWTMLYISASIVLVLSADDSTRGKSAEAHEVENPPKRRRLDKPVNELLADTRSTDLQRKIFALQVLTFVFDRIVVDVGSLNPYLEPLLQCLSDDNANIVSWALLVLTSAAGRDFACLPDIKPIWHRAWRLAARHITLSATCRAACQLMAVVLNFELIRYNEVSDVVDNMVSSVDLNGPAECVDSASTLWSIIVLLRGREHVGSVSETSKHIIRWLCNRWSPSKWASRDYAVHHSPHSNHRSIHHIFRLISVCLGFQYPPACLRPPLNLGLLSQAHFTCLNEKKLIEYLLLQDDSCTLPLREMPTAILRSWEINLSNVQFQNLSGNILDFLHAESGTLLRDEFSDHTENSSRICRGLIFIATSLSIIAYAMLAHGGIQGTRKGKDLRLVVDNLKSGILQCVLRQPQKTELIHGVYDSFEPFIGTLSTAFASKTLVSNGVISMAQGFDTEFWQGLRAAEIQFAADEEDAMDLDDEFESQGILGKVEKNDVNISHSKVAASTDALAFRNDLSAKICFLSGIRKRTDHDDLTDTLNLTSLVRYLTSLQRHEFLACGPFMREIFKIKTFFRCRDFNLLLEHFGQEILQRYDFERCEVSLGVVLDIMTSSAEMWTYTDYGEISEIGGKLYEWFIDIALKRGMLSPEVHKSISSMLQRVIKVRPEYARSRKKPLPSARTSLFKVLNEGNIRVKFHVGQNISEIFGLFILKEHDSILGDVIINLPTEIDCPEGMALRLFVLAHLASSWPTLLRRCVYAIFETPGHARESAKHAKYCLTLISRALQLDSLQGLFKLFVSQIIYTWLEKQQLADIPYGIFGYGSLPELLRDVQDEVIGQIVMRGKDDEATQLAKNLDKSYEELLELSFSKAAAYSIARDVAVPKQNPHAPGAEMRLRRTLGKERHSLLVVEFFPEILAIFYKTMDEVEHVEKGFRGRPAYLTVQKSYQEMISNSCSELALPVNQQPSFKARYLIDEVVSLCHRTSYEAESMWTPELYVYVFRELLNTIHPALGFLHACSVLRRIRVLISMAGPCALQDYPLEMALHALRPYITNTHCAEDAMGMFQYLVECGMEYLQNVPSSLVGEGLSTMVSLKTFLGSTQESTTQESQFRATMSKAQAFHRWLADSLDRFTSPDLSGNSENSFRALVTAARSLQGDGNSKKGTYESELLLGILEDQRSKRNILTQTYQDLILSHLCAAFEIPSSFRDDIFGSDEQAALYARVLWKTCQCGNYGESYLLWVGRVLGRAYAGTGLLDSEMTAETRLDFNHKSLPNTNTAPLQHSTFSILKLLWHIVLVENSVEVGMAETTLRSVVTRADQTSYITDCEQILPNSLMKAMLWRQYACPFDVSASPGGGTVQEKAAFEKNKSVSLWVQELCIALARVATNDPILSELPRILTKMTGLAEQAFPYVLHIVLEKEYQGRQTTRKAISEACSQWFSRSDLATVPHVKILLKAILYLRMQQLPDQKVNADRSRWLEIDYRLAAEAAARCSMFKTALLFLDISYSEVAKASRRSSAVKIQEPTDLLLCIFENIDEQDAFYGVQQPSSLSSMMTRLEYENAGFKSLSFRGAHYDSSIRLANGDREDEGSMVNILDSLDLNGLSQSLLSKISKSGPNSIDSMLQTARKLEQWDISAPASHASSTSTIFRVFQTINNATDYKALTFALDTGIQESMKTLMAGNTAGSSLQTTLSTLSILAETEEVLSSQDSDQLREACSRILSRDQWMNSASFKHVSSIISCRETLFSSLSKSKTLQNFLRTTQRDARALESHALLASSEMSRRHGALQNALGTAMYLTQLVKPCEDVGINITAAVQLESANILWAQGEMTASIRMLQELRQNFDPKSQLIHVGKSELLAKMGHQISEARLEKPDEIIDRYLAPAIKELNKVSEGDEAGAVFHEFASFCDQQLQNADGLEDFHRIQELRERKKAEVLDLERMMEASNVKAKEKELLKNHRETAEKWFKLDDREFQRLKDSREAFLRQSLENYLLCLKACDKYDNDALRFSALWLESWENEIANNAVARHVAQVGSRKFAPLMNQWSSRLLDLPSPFQKLLSSLILRICVDHPYHGMYQICAAIHTKGNRDKIALARNSAASNIETQLKDHKDANPIWMALHNTNTLFVTFASDRNDLVKQGRKVLLKRLDSGRKIESTVQNQKVPPPTMKIALRADCDYSSVPFIVKFHPEFSVASGISMPKIVTAIGTDGLKYKQLFKSGNDDLRQDSIMEQVFEQVSNLLQAQQATRQRKLRIRTYKVLPLSPSTGIIEFVQNTIPMHDYLLPAHQKHFPDDMKHSTCRNLIKDVQTKSVDERIKTFRRVTQRFRPVLRYFFMESFENPDDWFDKRLAYTRSTAAISILGHVLGLGDRHGHNILLDERTGEVVHIDLGIAFEQGRVLPIPEVVPFRLTRDIVDGMGITGIEGVFRRCCEFTLEALRNESYSIMTILDVLRYDPLYNWSISPVRLKRMQDAQNETVVGDRGAVGGGGAGGETVAERQQRKDEPGEADRALMVVSKKLSKSLSVTATVNELIQQAMDERNLALLFCGWAAYI
ncbi:Serine/threonine-protein kinase tel1 [Pseudocyphellaria aurata]|nr:Serine/threonine-protein kinase tel1 [Pseudocyphellaria aurata]